MVYHCEEVLHSKDDVAISRMEQSKGALKFSNENLQLIVQYSEPGANNRPSCFLFMRFLWYILINCILNNHLGGKEMRVPMIAGNWKMNTTVSEAVKLVGEMRPLLDPINNVEKVVCPPFVSLTAVKDALKGSSVKMGAQNMYFEEKGAYTGEVSPLMLAGLCEYVILGHSNGVSILVKPTKLSIKKSAPH